MLFSGGLYAASDRGYVKVQGLEGRREALLKLGQKAFYYN
jgi:hypothetical protein